VIGFVATTAYQKQTTVLIIFAVLAAVVTWFGSGADILGFLTDIYKDWKSEQGVPVLAFKGYSKGCEYVMTGDYGTILRTTISNAPTVWSHASVRRYDIGGRMDLRLFTVKGQTEIIFPSAYIQEGFAANSKPYDKFIDRDITIEIYSDYGNTPVPETKKIREIIKEAVEETEEQ
jgi:hypothetical protein